MASNGMARRHGLNLARSPLVKDATHGGPPKQSQPFPGSFRKLNPPADHGEESYEGGGKLAGQVALISGGDSGIGRAVAIAFAREGADVAISYLDEHEDAEDTLRWIQKAGRRGLLLPGDLRDADHARAIVRRTREELGGLNILVNNAAYHIESREFGEITEEQLDRTFRTNIYSFFWTTQEAVKGMKEGDAIINCGSVVAMQPYSQLMDYAATKAAIHNFTRNLAQALAPRGIRANCVAPGPVWTPLIASTRDEDFVGSFGSDTYWNRPAQPVEIATSFVFLASADSRFFTGEVLCPSGYQTTTR